MTTVQKIVNFGSGTIQLLRLFCNYNTSHAWLTRYITTAKTASGFVFSAAGFTAPRSHTVPAPIRPPAFRGDAGQDYFPGVPSGTSNKAELANRTFVHFHASVEEENEFILPSIRYRT